MTIEEIFLAAVEKTPTERAAYLENMCARDAGQRAQVEALLRSHEDAGSLLEQPLFLTAPTLTQAPPNESPGAAIGAYKLIEVIGEGGMGTVYLAQQSQPVRRLVALKVIKAGMDTAQVIARFEAERQALAMMDHPNIAKVFDAGATDQGRPYFVMELVKGVPITKYCDDHRLTPKQRLELFISVCQAVQHAHQKGIIHRDLKPTNVLVAPYDGRPVPKVIDFGVAKAAGQPLTEKTLVTGLGAVVGTLEYMSPEQAELNNLDVDTRSDIYSLGVLLYELLTGTTPHSGRRLKQAALLEALRLVREEEPPRPSTRLSTNEDLPSIAASRGLESRKLSGLVRGELDWIAMKALEKDRTRRYETATGLAADVQRYLANEAVQACPPSASYRFGKFARRNRRALATTVLLGVGLILAVIGLTISNWRIDRERAQTDQANARLTANLVVAEATLGDVSVKLAGWLPPDPEKKREYYELVEQVVRCYEQLTEQHGGPEAQASLAACHVSSGNLLLGSGETAKAGEHYRRALQLQTRVIAESPAFTDRRAATYLEQLAFILFHLADLLTKTGETDEAAGHYHRAFEILEQLASDRPKDARYHRCLAWNRATCVEPRFRDPDAAVRAAQKAAELDKADKTSWTCLGIAYYRVGQWRAAIEALDKGTARNDATAWFFLAMAHWRLGDKDEARRWYDKGMTRMPGPPYCFDPQRGAVGRNYWFPLRYHGFRAEVAALLGIDRTKP